MRGDGTFCRSPSSINDTSNGGKSRSWQCQNPKFEIARNIVATNRAGYFCRFRCSNSYRKHPFSQILKFEPNWDAERCRSGSLRGSEFSWILFPGRCRQRPPPNKGAIRASALGLRFLVLRTQLEANWATPRFPVPGAIAGIQPFRSGQEFNAETPRRKDAKVRTEASNSPASLRLGVSALNSFSKTACCSGAVTSHSIFVILVPPQISQPIS